MRAKNPLVCTTHFRGVFRPADTRSKEVFSFGGEGTFRGDYDCLRRGGQHSLRRSTKGEPTFLNLDKSYPNQIFTIVIWESNRRKFGVPETDYKSNRICVSGKITAYAGLPEIVADDPKQIQIYTGK